MHRIATAAPLGAVVTASCLVAGGIAAAAEPPRLCFPAGGGVIELGISRAALSRPGFGLLAGRTFGPDKQHGGCFTPRPLPIIGSYTTGADGRVAISLTQAIAIQDVNCAAPTYGLSLRAPRLRGQLCTREFDAEGCGPIEPGPCPRQSD